MIHHIAGRWTIKVVDETEEVFVECDVEVIVRLMDKRRKVRRGELIDKHDCSGGKRRWQQDQATLPGRDQPSILQAQSSRHGLSQVCRRIGYFQGSRLPLLVWRKSRHRPVYLDSPQRHQEGNSHHISHTSTHSSLTTVQEDGSRCSILSFDVTANKSRLPLAKNALRKFRTLRHPGVIKVLDTVEVVASRPLQDRPVLTGHQGRQTPTSTLQLNV